MHVGGSLCSMRQGCHENTVNLQLSTFEALGILSGALGRTLPPDLSLVVEHGFLLYLSAAAHGWSGDSILAQCLSSLTTAAAFRVSMTITRPQTSAK